MAVGMPKVGCGGHRPYRSRAEAAYKASWHLSCHKCRSGLVIGVWLCEPTRDHFHIGHRAPTEAERRVLG